VTIEGHGGFRGNGRWQGSLLARRVKRKFYGTPALGQNSAAAEVAELLSVDVAFFPGSFSLLRFRESLFLRRGESNVCICGRHQVA